MIKLISAVIVIDDFGPMMYSKIIDSDLNFNDSFLNDLRIDIRNYDEKIPSEKMNSFKKEEFYVIFRIPRERIYQRPFIVVLAKSINPLIFLKAGYIIYFLKKELVKKDGFVHYTSAIINGESYRVLTIDVKIESIINMSLIELNNLEKDGHVVQLQNTLNKLVKKIPPDKILKDSRIYFFDKNQIFVDPSITEDEYETIFNKIKNNVNKSYGKDFFEKILLQ